MTVENRSQGREERGGRVRTQSPAVGAMNSMYTFRNTPVSEGVFPGVKHGTQFAIMPLGPLPTHLTRVGHANVPTE